MHPVHNASCAVLASASYHDSELTAPLLFLKCYLPLSYAEEELHLNESRAPGGAQSRARPAFAISLAEMVRRAAPCERAAAHVRPVQR